jgi:hypothetical protein
VVAALRRELEKRKLLAVPRVRVSTRLEPNQIQRVREGVRRMHGQLVESPSEFGQRLGCRACCALCRSAVAAQACVLCR